MLKQAGDKRSPQKDVDQYIVEVREKRRSSPFLGGAGKRLAP
ncbi:hypothetical protein P3339_11600 [Microbulbifer sp. MLAF003]|nr:hypothetical protein [Microbulbifer sp. MLAF003]WHI53557.1 hypothetical protein P3339_11600 [Microbulbifer sp. MLAF003]